MEVLLANPRGFCAGVERAIGIVERALERHGPPIYVRHEIVHNKFVVDDLRKKGAVFVEELDEVPAGSTVVFSAHGVSKAVQADAEARGLRPSWWNRSEDAVMRLETSIALFALCLACNTSDRPAPNSAGTTAPAAGSIRKETAVKANR